MLRAPGDHDDGLVAGGFADAAPPDLQLLPRYLEAADEAEVFAGDGDPLLILRKDENGVDVKQPALWRRISGARDAKA
jgi:hypothetical protein